MRSISASGLILKQSKYKISRERQELDERSVQNTSRKRIVAHRLIMSIPLRGAT
jgi:hypothetical protein